MTITLTYNQARELNQYLKAWERVRASSEKGEIHFDQDKLEYDKNQDKVEVILIP